MRACIQTSSRKINVAPVGWFFKILRYSCTTVVFSYQPLTHAMCKYHEGQSPGSRRRKTLYTAPASIRQLSCPHIHLVFSESSASITETAHFSTVLALDITLDNKFNELYNQNDTRQRLFNRLDYLLLYEHWTVSGKWLLPLLDPVVSGCPSLGDTEVPHPSELLASDLRPLLAVVCWSPFCFLCLSPFCFLCWSAVVDLTKHWHHSFYTALLTSNHNY